MCSAKTPIPWLHIAHVVAEEARARGYRRLGLLGTRFTMGGSLYRDTLAAMGIETVVPEADDFDTVDRIIFSELVDGIFTDASRQDYHRVIVRLGERGCDAVALACTEIPLLVRSRGFAAAHARLHPAAGCGRATRGHGLTPLLSRPPSEALARRSRGRTVRATGGRVGSTPG